MSRLKLERSTLFSTGQNFEGQMDVKNISWMTGSQISGFLLDSSRQRYQVERDGAPPSDFRALRRRTGSAVPP
jgi:hypothetical protein